MSIFDRLSERFTDFLDEVRLPEELRNLYEKAHQAMRRGDYLLALQWLDDAERRRPGEERTRHLQGLCHFHLGELERAIALFEEALQIREEASSHFYLGLSFEKKGTLDEAITHLHRALELAPDPPFAFELYTALARIYLAINRPDKAAREARRALKIWPNQRDASIILAQALYHRRRFEEARQLLHKFADDDGDRDFYLTLGRLESATEHHGAAAAAFEAILTREPDDLEALLGAAQSFLALNQPPKANAHLIRALGGAPDTTTQAKIYTLIGATNEAIHNLDKARESYDAALSRDPDNLEARHGAARQALLNDEPETAAEHFVYLLRAGLPKYRGEALLGLGRCRLAQDDPAGARHLLEEASQFYPAQTPELLEALGSTALSSDDPAEALVLFREALHADPTPTLKARLDLYIAQALAALRPQWSLPDEFDSTAQLLSTLRTLRDLLNKEPRLEAYLPQVHELLSTLDSPLSVAILGEFNAGKSTLVNAILAEAVVPMGVLPTTAHPCIMAYGPRKGARIVYTDGRLQDVDFATARELMRKQAQAIARLEYTYPHPELRSINYWDTPGFNALDSRHEELASAALQQAEAILWLVDANQALSQTEFDRLEQIPDSNQRVLMVLNKIDRFGDHAHRQEDVAEIVEYLKENVGDQVVDVLAISALEALKVRTDQAQQNTTDADFQALMRFLDEHFVQRSWQIKISEVSRALRALLDKIAAHRQEEIARFEALLDQASSIQTLVKEADEQLQTRPQEFAISISDRLDFALVGVEREIAQSLRQPGRFSRRLILEPEDRSFILELLRERLNSVLEHHRQQLLQEISELESRLAARLSPLFADLSVTDARPLRRRLEGLFDETRVLKTTLEERVFGQWRARTDGQIRAGGEAALDHIVALGPEGSPKDRRRLLTALIPDFDAAFQQDLRQWHEEFFLAAHRFCDNLHRDLTTLELETRHRLDFQHGE